jgi:hypothetical protein
MAALPYGASLVLPSPNGATCTLLAAGHFGELAVWEGRNAAPPQLAHLGDEEDRDRQGDDGHSPDGRTVAVPKATASGPASATPTGARAWLLVSGPHHELTPGPGRPPRTQR